MLSSTPILSLPQEIIIKISFHLTTVELGLFRRSCKHIEKYLFHSFTKEFFTKRQFLLEHESLEALLGIASHPGLGPHLQEVIIDVRVFEHTMCTEYVRFMKRRLQSGHLDHQMLLYTGKALAMLTETFSKLKNLRSVGIRDANGRGRYRDGELAFWRPWGWSSTNGLYDTLAFPENVNHILPLVMSALAHAHAKPTNLEVLLTRDTLLGRDAFALKDIVDFANVLGSLKTIMLKMGKSDVESELLAYGLPQENARLVYELPIISFLHSLKSVEHLRLNFDGRWYTEDTLLVWLSGRYLQNDASKSLDDLVVPTLDFKMLTTLDIGFVGISTGELTRILVRFSLKSFALWRITLLHGDNVKKEDNCWSVFLAELSRKLPKPSIIRKILIGHTRQDRVPRQVNSASARVTWKPLTSQTAKTDETTRSEIINYDSLHSSENAHNWLAKVSKLAFIEPKPSIIRFPYHSEESEEGEEEASFTDDEDDLDTDDEEEDDDDDEEEDNEESGE